jgi:hypothetical protein
VDLFTRLGSYATLAIELCNYVTLDRLRFVLDRIITLCGFCLLHFSRASLSCYACWVCYKHVAALHCTTTSLVLYPSSVFFLVMTIVLFPIWFYSMFVEGGAAIFQYLRACVFFVLALPCVHDSYFCRRWCCNCSGLGCSCCLVRSCLGYWCHLVVYCLTKIMLVLIKFFVPSDAGSLHKKSLSMYVLIKSRPVAIPYIH